LNPEQLISPTLHTAAIGALETVINRALGLDPATQRKLAELGGHVFQLECTRPALSLYFIPGSEEVRLCGIYDGNVDTAIKGQASEFAQLASAADPANVLINSDITLHGDAQALIALQKILKQLDIDWEAPLANLFGDVAGYHLGRGLRQGFGFLRGVARSFKRQVDEYIVEESELLPARHEVERFFNEVDQLAMQSDRLEAKLQRLKQQLQQGRPS
jgi:ubiquinone biosynthesis protein UbiJ